MYLHLTSNTNTNDIIFLFHYYLSAYLKFYAVYINAGLHFTSHNLHTYFQKKDIAVVFALSAFYKLVDLIEKTNNILQLAFKMMQEPGKE